MCYSLSKTFKIARTNMGILIAVMVAGNFDIWQTQEKYPFIYIYIYVVADQRSTNVYSPPTL